MSALRRGLEQLREGVRVLFKAMRTDHQGEFWAVRKWLDARGIYNDDLQGSRVLEAAVKALLSDADALLASSPEEPPTCATCRFWLVDIDTETQVGGKFVTLETGECSRQMTKPTPIFQSRGQCIRTTTDFGCNQHVPAERGAGTGDE